MKNYHQKFKEGCFYHIYNRAIGNEKLFLQDENYSYFLKRFSYYLKDYVNTYAFCLLPNHYHFLIEIKKISEPASFDYEKVVTEAFRNFFISYTKSINARFNRCGGLFQAHFNRKLIDTVNYQQHCLIYIHLNPVLHNYVDNPEDWNYSSFTAFLSDKPSSIRRQEAIGWFDDENNFNFMHKQSLAEKYALDMDIDF
ncbi:transposase [Bacteroidota bacterium]